MSRCLWILLLLTAGCLKAQHQTATVQNNPFGHVPPAPPPTQATYAAPSTDIAVRVDSIGRGVLSANVYFEHTGVKPLFRTVGAPQAQIFHRGTTEIVITEGLVRQCASDGQLAALFCVELGKMIAERDAQSGPRFVMPEKSPPMDLRFGNDSGGPFGPADQTYRAEMGIYEKEYNRRLEASQKPLDPLVLAKCYLINTGYPASELDAIAPLLRSTANKDSSVKPTAPPAQPNQ